MVLRSMGYAGIADDGIDVFSYVWIRRSGPAGPPPTQKISRPIWLLTRQPSTRPQTHRDFGLIAEMRAPLGSLLFLLAWRANLAKKMAYRL